MEHEKGKLLYDEFKSYRRISNKVLPSCFIFVIIIFIIGLITGLIYSLITFEQKLFASAVILVFITISFIMLWAMLLKGYARVYENGYAEPIRTIKQTLRREENFVSFHDVIELYPNRCNNLDYITIIKKSQSRPKKIYKFEFQDIDAFLSNLQGRINIIMDRDYFL